MIKITAPTVEFEMFGDWRPDGGIGIDFSRNGCHEPVGSEFIAEAVRNRQQHEPLVFWDIGAAYGYYSMLVKEVEPTTSVHAFEPGEKRMPYLNANQDRSPPEFRIVPEPLSAGQTLGPTPMDYAQTHGYPDLVKCDIDGAELDLLEELGTVLGEADDSALLLEMHTRGDYDSARLELLAVIESWENPTIKICMNHRMADAEFETVDPEAIPEEEDLDVSDYLVAVERGD